MLLLALFTNQLAAAGSPQADRIIVKWRSAPDTALRYRQDHVRDLTERLGRPFVAARNLGGSLSVMQLDASQGDARRLAVIAALRADPQVEFAEFDLRVKPMVYSPSDPYFRGFFFYNQQFYRYQWYLRSSQPASIRADFAWDITRAGSSPETSPVVIAVVDSGVRPAHPDLAGKLLPGFDFISDPRASNDGDGWDADPTDTGDYLTAEELQRAPFNDPAQKCGGGDNYDEALPSSWHGTRVAGLLAADTDNNLGMAGTAFNARILPVRVLGKCGGYLSDVLAGMYWAAGFFDEASGLPIPAELLVDPGALRRHPNQHPAQIINMSLGSSGGCSDVYATAVREITAAGVLIVAAAGNDGGPVYQPADCPGVLAVAGLRHAGTKVGFSNLGPQVAVGAPAGNCGVDIEDAPCLYALNTLTNLGQQEPGTEGYSLPTSHPSYGTSFSAPLVAGTAGLMKAVNPALTPVQIIARIRETARAFPTSDELGTTAICMVPDEAPEQDAPCICTTEVCGAGMLDAGDAVQAALRPAVLVAVKRSGGNYRLDGSASAAADHGDRRITRYQWTVTGVSGGAAVPVITDADMPVASVPVPATGTVGIQLQVTDSNGDSDTADVTLTHDSAVSSSPPPVTAIHRSGGGRLGPWSLALLFLLWLARRHIALAARSRRG